MNVFACALIYSRVTKGGFENLYCQHISLNVPFASEFLYEEISIGLAVGENADSTQRRVKEIGSSPFGMFYSTRENARFQLENEPICKRGGKGC